MTACSDLGEPAPPTPDFPQPIGAALTRMDAYNSSRKARSLAIVEATIKGLVAQWRHVPSKPQIHAHSPNFDKDGIGVSLSVLYQNKECDELIRRAKNELAALPVAVPYKARRIGQRRLGELVAEAERVVDEIDRQLFSTNEQLLRNATPRLLEQSIRLRIKWLRAADDLRRHEQKAAQKAPPPMRPSR